MEAVMIEETVSANNLDIEDTQKTFDYWLKKPYISESLRASLSKANVLIVPLEGYYDKHPVFADFTERLLNFLKSSGHEGLLPDICIEESDYVELAQHGRTLILIGAFILSSIVAPIFVNLISDYIKERLGADDKRIKIEMTVVDENGKGKQFRYEGSAQSFKDIILPRLKGRNE